MMQTRTCGPLPAQPFWTNPRVRARQAPAVLQPPDTAALEKRPARGRGRWKVGAVELMCTGLQITWGAGAADLDAQRLGCSVGRPRSCLGPLSCAVLQLHCPGPLHFAANQLSCCGLHLHVLGVVGWSCLWSYIHAAQTEGDAGMVIAEAGDAGHGVEGAGAGL
eukprot:988857-Pelagomonas_calceolata.AAC.1